MLQERLSAAAMHKPNVRSATALHDDGAYAAALDALSSHVAILDPTGKCIVVNKAWRDFAGHHGPQDPTVVLGNCYIHAWDPVAASAQPDAIRAATGVCAVLDGREPTFIIEYAYASPVRQCWFRMQVSPIGENGALGAVLVHEDITSRIQGEMERQRHIRQFHEYKESLEKRTAAKTQRACAIMDSALDAIITADHQDRIESCNIAATRLFGRSAAEMLGQPLTSFFAELPACSAASPADTAGAAHETFALQIEGRTVPVYLSTSTLVFGEETLRVCIAHDISERRAIETELLDKAEELARRNKELDEFTYVASHDFQEPLRKLIAFSELLPKDMQGEIPEVAQRDLYFITDASVRMQQLITDLLTLARTSRAGLQRVEVSLESCVERALASLSYRIAETRAEVTRDELPCVVADACLVEQLYLNLIANAIKFSGDKPPRIHLTARRESSDWVFGVQDWGIGIAPKYATMIFAPFKRLHSREHYDGTGIGLAICRKAVERHGGRIWVESTPGEGAHFKFTLS
jgi:PAS domain S-box-containing protein